LASAIPISELIFKKCDFFLDTIFWGFYTFVNCKVSLAGSMSTRQRENRNNGNQESSSEEAGEEGSQKSSKEEVSRQRNRQHTRGTPKASPEVFLRFAESSMFKRVRATSPQSAMTLPHWHTRRRSKGRGSSNLIFLVVHSPRSRHFATGRRLQKNCISDGAGPFAQTASKPYQSGSRT
jgi:hypothetical protein